MAMNTQQNEISRLRADLGKALLTQDSLIRRKDLGKQLFRELKPLYPELTHCGAADQVLYDDSLRSHQYLALFLGSSDRRKTVSDQEKLEQWLRSRLKTDSVKIYVE